MDKRDAILQAHVPTIMVPRYRELEPLATDGHRFLVAQDGLWVEVRRPWIFARWPFDMETEVQLPYGPINGCGQLLSFEWDNVERLIQSFADHATGRLPDECGAIVTWRENVRGRDALTLHLLRAIEASPGALRYERPALAPGEHLVCDIHSHGTQPAFFSATDDTDDACELKFSVVVGNLNPDADSFATAMRLCLPGGLFVNDYEWQGF